MSTSIFSSVAQKHLTDATLLLEQDRYDNAYYLSGYVVEASLKVLLAFDGMPAVKELGHNLEMMTGNALMLAYHLAPSRRRYNPGTSAELENIIQNWRPEARYDAEGTYNKAQAESEIRGATFAYEQIVIAMKLDGNLK